MKNLLSISVFIAFVFTLGIAGIRLFSSAEINHVGGRGEASYLTALGKKGRVVEVVFNKRILKIDSTYFEANPDLYTRSNNVEEMSIKLLYPSMEPRNHRNYNDFYGVRGLGDVLYIHLSSRKNITKEYSYEVANWHKVFRSMMEPLDLVGNRYGADYYLQERNNKSGELYVSLFKNNIKTVIKCDIAQKKSNKESSCHHIYVNRESDAVVRIIYRKDFIGDWARIQKLVDKKIYEFIS